MSDFEISISNANYDDDVSLARELRGLDNDRIMTQRIIKTQQEAWIRSLNGKLGEDMRDVLNGKKTVKVPWKMKLKYRWNKFINNLLKFI